MNIQTQTAAAIPATAQTTSTANVAAVNATATVHPAPGKAWPQDLTTIDEMVFAIDQLAANEPQTPPQQSPAAAFLPTDYSPSDVGNAERFCDLWGEVTRYDVGRGCWMLWSGTHWEPDAKGDARVNSDLKRIQILLCQRFKTDTPPWLNTVRVQPISATSLPLIIPA